MKRILILLTVTASLFGPRGPVLAHHGQAAYNMAASVTVTGIVTEFQFANPHCIVHVDAKAENGELQKWQGELTSPNHLVRAGWNPHSINAGDQIALTGWRAKSGANSLWITKTVVNGHELKTAAGT
jgi:hypothetical protein